MTQISISVNTADVIAMFKDLYPSRQKAVYRTALRKGADVLIKNTRENLKGVVDGSIYKKRPNQKYSMAGGIRRSGTDRDATFISVHIMGNYKLKWFEKGTTDRYTLNRNGKRKSKAGAYRGKITGKYFFRNAIDTSEKQVFEIFDEELVKAIIKITSKYGGIG